MAPLHLMILTVKMLELGVNLVSKIVLGMFYCFHKRIFGLSTTDTCHHGDVRLVGGLSAYEGRVELCHNQRWGTVCDDGWSTFDVQAVCRQLGYNPQGIYVLYTF